MSTLRSEEKTASGIEAAFTHEAMQARDERQTLESALVYREALSRIAALPQHAADDATNLACLEVAKRIAREALGR